MENSDMVVKELDIINDQNLNNVIVQDVNNFKNIVLNENQIKLFNEILQNYLENLNKDEIFHVNEIVRDDYILKNNLQSSLNLELSHQNSVVLNNFDINSEVVNSYKTTNIFDFDKSYE